MSYAGEKKALRRASLTARDALDSDTRQQHSRAICRLAADFPRRFAARCVATYAPMGSEVDVEPLLVSWVAQGLVVALPRMRADGRLDFVAVKSFAGLTAGRWGIREPAGVALPTAQLDLVMAPGLAFDGEGHRLGYGGGYYDRTFLGYTQAVIGVAFSLQIRASLPAAPHDRCMDGVVCELGYKAGRGPHNSGQTSGPVAP